MAVEITDVVSMLDVIQGDLDAILEMLHVLRLQKNSPKNIQSLIEFAGDFQTEVFLLIASAPR